MSHQVSSSHEHSYIIGVCREGAERELNPRTQKNQVTDPRCYHPNVPIEIDL
jgi:hypothetical protein